MAARLKKVLCVIPVRGGSKGVPGKNLRLVGGRPLLAWVCEAARGANCVSRAVVSTDDPALAKIAAEGGIEVSQRVAELATDTALVVDVLAAELCKAEADDKVEYPLVCLLQATSPFVLPDDIERAVALATSSGADTVLSVYEVGQKHPEIMMELSEAGEVKWFCGAEKRMARRQDLPAVYARSGLVYVVRRDVLLSKRSIYGDKVMAVKVDPIRALSIDCEADLVAANALVEKGLIARPDGVAGAVAGTLADAAKPGDFEARWKAQPELAYVHWTRDAPANQIQLAFRSHWNLFCELLGRKKGRGLKSLEVGCGRGSMSCYFADAGYDCTLLDNAPTAIEQAVKMYSELSFKAKCDVGDALALPYEDNTFDVVFSIGLLEHFKSIDKVLAEQVRVLKSGGLLLVYVVPEKKVLAQERYEWVNRLTRRLAEADGRELAPAKARIFRTKYRSDRYLACLKKLGVKSPKASGVYPLPMISFSPDFPFSLMPPECEKELVGEFGRILKKRRKATGENPWLCDEDEGQAFLVWARKK